MSLQPYSTARRRRKEAKKFSRLAPPDKLATTCWPHFLVAAILIELAFVSLQGGVSAPQLTDSFPHAVAPLDTWMWAEKHY